MLLREFLCKFTKLYLIIIFCLDLILINVFCLPCLQRGLRRFSYSIFTFNCWRIHTVKSESRILLSPLRLQDFLSTRCFHTLWMRLWNYIMLDFKLLEMLITLRDQNLLIIIIISWATLVFLRRIAKIFFLDVVFIFDSFCAHKYTAILIRLVICLLIM